MTAADHTAFPSNGPGPGRLDVPLNDLGRGAHLLREELAAASARVLESGWYVHGPEHGAFEAEFADYLGVPHVVGVGNGTDALELALRALTPTPGSVVLTAANAGMYASTAIRRAGLRPRYADVDPQSLLLDASTVRAALDSDVSTVVVTHLYGRIADVAAIREVCSDVGAKVLEDCAQATGAGEIGSRAGSLGDAASFSFYPTKNLGALGDGGAVTTASDQVAERVRELRQYGWRSKYHVAVDGGRNSRLDELQAAFLRVRLPNVNRWNARRREIIGTYVRAAEGSGIRVLPAVGTSHAAHLAVALSPARDEVRHTLGVAGVRTDVHYPVPDHKQEPFTQDYASLCLPVTESAAGQVFSLPCFPELTAEEVDHVCAVLSGL